MVLRVASAEGEIRLRYRNIQYLQIESKITGNVAFNQTLSVQI